MMAFVPEPTNTNPPATIGVDINTSSPRAFQRIRPSRGAIAISSLAKSTANSRQPSYARPPLILLWRLTVHRTDGKAAGTIALCVEFIWYVVHGCAEAAGGAGEPHAVRTRHDAIAPKIARLPTFT